MDWCKRRRRGRGRIATTGATAVLALSTSLLAGCALIGGPKTIQLDVPDQMRVSSPDVAQGVMGSAFTCRGGRSPGLHWSGAPQGTKSFAVIMDDSAAPIKPYIYWIVFDIGPQQTVIQAGQIPPGARQARNSKGSASYDPPCPIKESHAYRFTVYALGSWLQLKPGASTKNAWSQIAQAAIARGRLTVVGKP